jgi:hypothetical protein
MARGGGGGLQLLPYLSAADPTRHRAMVVKLVHNSLALYVRDPDFDVKAHLFAKSDDGTFFLLPIISTNRIAGKIKA